MATDDIISEVTPSHELLRENLTSSIMEKTKMSLRKKPAPKVKKKPTKRVSIHKCQECKKEFKQRRLLKSHMLSHSTARPFKCPQCTHTCKSSSYLSAHIKKVHIRDKRYVCDLCPKRFLWPSKLANHRRVHTGEKPYKCNLCDKSFSASYCLSVHKYIHTNEKPYKCMYCDYACRDTSTLRKHQQRHISVESYFKCKLCDKEYRNKVTLKCHVAEAHLRVAIRKYECDTCNARFRLKGNLIKHIRTVHDKSTTMKCEICNLNVSNKINLINHMRVHVDAKPFRCQEAGCGKGFKDGSTLRKHTKTHIERHVEYHTCEYCQIPFTYKQDLKAHMRLKHTLLNGKYICDHCNFETTLKTCIVMHIKHKHKGENYSCKICKKVYKLKHYFVKHNYKKHGIGVKTKEPSPTREIAIKDEAMSENDGLDFLQIIKTESIDDFGEKVTHSNIESSETITDNIDTSCTLDNVSTEEATSLGVIAQTEPDNLINNTQNPATNHENANTLNEIEINRMSSAEINKELDLNQEIDISNPDSSNFIDNVEGISNKIVIRDSIKAEDTNTSQNSNGVKDVAINSEIGSSEIVQNKSEARKIEKKCAKKIRKKHFKSKRKKCKDKESFADFMKTFGVDLDEIEVSTNDDLNKDLAEIIMDSQGKKMDEIPKEIFDEYFIEHYTKKADDLKVDLRKDQTEEALVQKSVKELLNQRKDKLILRDKKSLKRVSDDEVREITKNYKCDEREKNRTEEALMEKRRKDLAGEGKKTIKGNKNTLKRKGVRKSNRDRKMKKNDRRNKIETDKPKSIEDTEKLSDNKSKDEKHEGNETLSEKLTKNMHQCYVCLKVLDTKAKLMDHCKDHFDLCTETTLKKCPLCDFVTNLCINTHLQRKHKIKLKYSYSTIYQKHEKTGLKFFYKVDHPKVDRIEIIPSIRHLNKTASMNIDKRHREMKDQVVSKTKLVKKGDEWVVEEERIDIKDGYTVLKAKGSVNGEYIEKMKELYKEAKKKGEKMVFPCKNCEKVCLTLSGLKLHHRKHDANAKPFKKKVWKHKLKDGNNKVKNTDKLVTVDKEKTIHSDNRQAKPKPIKNKHKCDPALKKFYENNIKGGDIEFWQFLKIFNKLGREKVEDFEELEKRTDFGIHKVVDNSESNNTKTNNTNENNKTPNKLAKTAKVKRNAFVKVLKLTRKEYLKRLSVKQRLRDKIASNKNQ